MFGLPFGEDDASVARTAQEQSPVVRDEGEFLKQGICDVGGEGSMEFWR